MRIGILGTGSIAHKMAATILALEDKGIYLTAVASRNIENAKAFQKEFSIKNAYGSYLELVETNEVDLVYIATPHSCHYENILLCLNHNKHVLCEKAFTVNSKQAEIVLNLAREKNLILLEAIWTRYMPSRKIISDLLESDVIGNVFGLSANLSYNIKNINRLINPDLAGGALLDVGVYPLNFAVMVFGERISKIEATAIIKNGVDYSNNIVLVYDDNKMCHLNSSLLGISDRNGYIYGDKGYIMVKNINNPEKVYIYKDYEVVKEMDIPKQISGYEYQIIEAKRLFDSKKTESSYMTSENIIYIMSLLDEIRAKIGLKYPENIEKV